MIECLLQCSTLFTDLQLHVRYTTVSIAISLDIDIGRTPGNELPGIEWLGDIVVSSGKQTLDLGLITASGGTAAFQSTAVRGNMKIHSQHDDR